MSTPCFARKKLYDKAPLYEDPNGWQIWNIHASEELVSWYYDGKFRANSAGKDVAFPAFERMAEGPYESFYAFPLIIPDGMSTLWSKNSVITMTYLYKGEVHEVRSSEMFVQRMCGGGELVVVNEVATFIPSPGCVLFCTSRGNPVIFVKFPLSRVPDKVLGCTVENVITKERA